MYKLPEGKIALFDSGQPIPEHHKARFEREGWPPDLHAALREPEYPYQLELLFDEALEDYPNIVRAEAPDGRRWEKRNNRLVRVEDS